MNSRDSILLAITDPVELAQLESLLAEAGFQVAAVQDPLQLIQTVEQRGPGAVLLGADFSGPGAGVALCRHLKGGVRTRATPVVLLCGRREQLQPTDGTDGLPDEVLLRPIHPPEVIVRLAGVLRLQHYADELVGGSKMDPLTGTFNSSYLLDRLRHEVLRAQRYGRSVALVLLDLDGFGAINGREGATFGDLVLREVARALTSRLRGVDLVARSGADEFSVVLPETSLLVARPVAERLRLAVESLSNLEAGEERRPLQVTASLGIAGVPHAAVRDVPDLLRCTRLALSRAQEAGGNRCLIF